MGTGRFLAIQTVVVIVWITLNLVAVSLRWDPYPFILLNLAFSTQAAYAAPLILLAQNRQDDRDRVSLEEDRARAAQTKADTEYLARELAALRLAVGEVVTRDFLRGELDKLAERLGAARSPSSATGTPSDRGRRGSVGQPATDPVERREVVGVEPVGEVAGDPGEVGPRGHPQPLEAGVGQVGGDAAPVGLHGCAGDQPRPLQPVDQPGHPGAGEQDRVRELGHAQPALRGFGELDEHVVRGEGQPLLGDELGLERPGDPGVCPQERPPRGQLLPAEPPEGTGGLRHASMLGRVSRISVDGIRDPGRVRQGGGRLSYRAYLSRPTTQQGAAWARIPRARSGRRGLRPARHRVPRT